MTDSFPRRLLKRKEAAVYLDIDVKTLDRLIDGGKLRYILIEPTSMKRYDVKDLDAYIEQQRGAACPSTRLKNHRSGSIASTSRVIGFMARLELDQKKKPKSSRLTSEARP